MAAQLRARCPKRCASGCRASTSASRVSARSGPGRENSRVPSKAARRPARPAGVPRNACLAPASARPASASACGSEKPHRAKRTTSGDASCSWEGVNCTASASRPRRSSPPAMRMSSGTQEPAANQGSGHCTHMTRCLGRPVATPAATAMRRLMSSTSARPLAPAPTASATACMSANTSARLLAARCTTRQRKPRQPASASSHCGTASAEPGSQHGTSCTCVSSTSGRSRRSSSKCVLYTATPLERSTSDCAGLGAHIATSPRPDLQVDMAWSITQQSSSRLPSLFSVTAGTLDTSGASHSWERPTSRRAIPSATSVSVALGSSDTTRGPPPALAIPPSGGCTSASAPERSVCPLLRWWSASCSWTSALFLASTVRPRSS
mmetsp:Transcript_47682/g.121664  ORF Transcript_47682/g.121664 Transcript_47682/m.121664 type:complete len:380 (-) Transcript_47682:25-1164(-)